MLDADVIIGGEKGSFDLHSWFASQPNETFEIAAITVAELWHGVERATGSHKATRRNYVERIVGLLPIVPSGNPTSKPLV